MRFKRWRDGGSAGGGGRPRPAAKPNLDGGPVGGKGNKSVIVSFDVGDGSKSTARKTGGGTSSRSVPRTSGRRKRPIRG